MPVTAKLSKRFYERLGEDVANELVDWFNAVDATYRDDLHRLNELNFTRFDARLEQRIAELRSELRSDLGREVSGLHQRLADTRAELVKWMFGFWTGTVVPLGGLILALHLL